MPYEGLVYKYTSELEFTILIIALACYIHYIKAGYLGVPKQLEECFVAVFHVHVGIGLPVNETTPYTALTLTLLTSSQSNCITLSCSVGPKPDFNLIIYLIPNLISGYQVQGGYFCYQV